MTLGVPAVIFVPTVSSPAKIARIEGYGARIVVGGDRYSDAYEASLGHIAETGALAVHAFDSVETLCGQGTLGMELEEQKPELDTLPTLRDALAAGRPVDAPAGSIASDSLAPRRVGELMFPIAQRHIDSVRLRRRLFRQVPSRVRRAHRRRRQRRQHDRHLDVTVMLAHDCRSFDKLRKDKHGARTSFDKLRMTKLCAVFEFADDLGARCAQGRMLGIGAERQVFPAALAFVAGGREELDPRAGTRRR